VVGVDKTWRNISIEALTDPIPGEQRAQACDIAWLQHPIPVVRAVAVKSSCDKCQLRRSPVEIGLWRAS